MPVTRAVRTRRCPAPPRWTIRNRGEGHMDNWPLNESAAEQRAPERRTPTRRQAGSGTPGPGAPAAGRADDRSWTLSFWLVLGGLVALLAAGVAAVLLVRVFRARKLLLDAGVPLRSKALMWAAVIYTVSPVDLAAGSRVPRRHRFPAAGLRSLHTAANAAGLGARGGKRADEAATFRRPGATDVT